MVSVALANFASAGAQQSQAPETTAEATEDFRRLDETILQQPEAKRALEAALEEARESDRDAQTPAADRARDDSRDEFEDLTDREALEAAEESFPDLLGRPQFPKLDLGPGEEVESMPGKFGVIVDAKDSPPGLVESNYPLIANDDQGEKRLLDPDLERDGDTFQPENDLIDASLPTSFEGGQLELGGLDLALVPGGPSSGEAQITGDKAFYASVSGEEGLDLMAAPLPIGLKLAFFIRSPDVDERQTLIFDLPPGGRLERAPADDGANLIQDGRQVGHIPTPVAIDAAGQPVPSSFEVESDRLITQVRHRSPQTTYPVALDPAVLKDDYNWLISPTIGAGPPNDKWQYSFQSRPTLTGGPNDRWNDLFNFGPQIRARSGFGFTSGDYAQYTRSAIASQAFMEQVDVTSYFDPRSRTGTANACTYIGIFDQAGFRWEPGSPVYRCSPHYYENRSVPVGNFGVPGVPGDPEGANINVIAFGVQMSNSGPRTTDADAYFGMASLHFYDRDKPIVTQTPGSSSNWVDNANSSGVPQNESFSPRITDQGFGPKSYVLTGRAINPPSASPDRLEFIRPCTGVRDDRCLTPWDPQVSHPLAEGKTDLSFTAKDLADKNSEPAATWTKRIDRTPPDVETSGPFKDVTQLGAPLVSTAQSLNLKIKATDGSNASPAQQRSGVRRIEVRVDGELKGSRDQIGGCLLSSCPLEYDFGFVPNQYSNGQHEVKVTAFDYVQQSGTEARHKTTQTFNVTVVAPDALPPEPGSDRSGLEEWMQYDSTDTGAGSRAHVNLATGNLVWHWVPLVNPGRGLSSFVNLTYNSQEPLTSLLPISVPGLQNYNQAGDGFSISASGLTRINEPLDVTLASLGLIRLTDADGTQHTFRSTDGGQSFTDPAGVNLRLRRFATEQRSPKYWAITRPDGVTYYFDERGYQTSVEDRNGNKLTYQYKVDSPSPQACADLGLAGLLLGDILCRPYLDTVTDATGRKITFAYTGSGAAKRIKTITDHKGRTMTLAYEEGLGRTGLLASVTQAPSANDPGQPRTIGFSYQADLLDPDLEKVTDSKGAATDVGYGPLQIGGVNVAPDAGILQRVLNLASTLERVIRITDRGHGPSVTGGPERGVTGYGYRDQVLSAGLTEEQEATKVTKPRGGVWDYILDGLARPLSITDPARGPPEGRRARTELQWDADNNVVRMTEAAGSPDASTSRMAYNASGLLTQQIRADDTDDRRVTDLVYRDFAGTQLSPLGLDANKTFVSDLVSMTSPKGTVTPETNDFTWRWDVSNLGNVEEQRDPRGHLVEMDYDQHGQLELERAYNRGAPPENPDTTRFEEYDPNGFAQKITDPEGEVWRYTYDEDVGNLEEARDPRGNGETECGTRARFTSYLTYDYLDRPIKEVTPKLSAECRFITRETQYDRNDNVEVQIDGTGARFENAFSPMDEVLESRTPAVPHEGQQSNAPEIARFRYDQDGNQVLEERPKGVASATVGDFSTELRYDLLNQLVARIERSRGGTAPENDELRSSFDYDLRGNRVGLSDPGQNADHSTTAPEQNAKMPERRRYTFEFDKVDNQTAAIEDPGDLALRSETRFDRNDNPVARLDPRAFQAGVDEADFTTQFGYDQRDLLVSQTDPKGGRTSFDLRDDGLIQSETTPRGNEGGGGQGFFHTDYTYDDRGDLLTRSIPRAPNQYGPVDPEDNTRGAQVRYERNEVGDPIAITDGRDNRFTNDFLDSGQVSQTDRPSWWRYDAQADAVVESPRDLERNPDRDVSLPSIEGEGDFGQVKGAQMPDWMPEAGSTRLHYDDELRLDEVTDTEGASSRIDRDALGRFQSTRRPLDVNAANEGEFIEERYSYDLNGNLSRFIDGEGTRGDQPDNAYSTVRRYDQFDRLTELEEPGSQGGRELTKLGYDPNSNLLSRQTPRGPGFTWTQTYDAIDRLATRTNPAGDTESFDYDGADNVILERSPRGNGDSEDRDGKAPEFFDTRSRYDGRNLLTERTVSQNEFERVTRFDYDADWNRTQITAPGAKREPGAEVEEQVTERLYDGRGLLWQETTGTDGGPSRDFKRITGWEYDPNQNLVRTVRPQAFEDGYNPWNQATDASDAARNAEVREYNEDDVMRQIRLPWRAGDTESERYRQEFVIGPRGWTEEIVAPHAGSDEIVRTCYTHFDTGWIASSSDDKVDDPREGCAGNDQKFTYRYDRRGYQTRWESDRTQANDERVVTRDYFPSGMLERRSADDPTQGVEDRTYFYEYNENRSRTRIEEQGAQGRDPFIEIAYDEAERERIVNNHRAGEDSKFDYNRDGQVTERRTEGRVDPQTEEIIGEKLTSFTYDPLGQETATKVQHHGRTDQTRSEYYDSGQRMMRMKPNDTEERFYFSDDGRISMRDREGDPAQRYEYDENGNRELDERGEYDFNARDQLVEWVKNPDEPDERRVTYELNGTGAIKREVDDQGPDEETLTTRSEFNGYRLDFTERTLGASAPVRANYVHNLFGSVIRIEAEGEQDTVLEYDGFERMTKSSGPGAPDEEYDYDGLDRREHREKENSETDYSYIGTSNALTREEKGTKSRSFDYDSGMEKLGLATSEGSGTPDYRAYDKDANGSIIGLEVANGDVDATDRYEYDPYGALESEEDELSDAAHDNPLRFEGFYYDSGIKQYDMQARTYRPDIARFVSQDRYESAGADFNLQADPLTQNRAAFAGGNPVSRVEFDGHKWGGWGTSATSTGSRGSTGRTAERDGRAAAAAGAAAGAAAAGQKGASPSPMSESLSGTRSSTDSEEPPALYTADDGWGDGPSLDQHNAWVLSGDIPERPADFDQLGFTERLNFLYRDHPDASCFGGCFPPPPAPDTAAEVALKAWTFGETLTVIGAIRREAVEQGIRRVDDVIEEVDDTTVIVRGGQSDVPPPGQVFSGSQGRSVEDAAAGVPHGTIRSTTAGRIRADGGTVRRAPEFNERVGRTNEQHVDVCLGPSSCPFSDPFANPVPKSGRFGGADYPYGGDW